MASVHDRLERVRKPRVHITYKVETGGAEVVRELPFVVGVLGDFIGDPNPDKPVKPLTDRSFVTIDKDNFDHVMSSLSPNLKLRVENTLADDGSEMAVDLTFNSLDDFDPTHVVNRVPQLKKLLDTRNKLRDLMAKADRSVELEDTLEAILRDKSGLSNLSSLLDKDGAEKKEG
ncbi:MAG: type VI secretion system contractile sheath small subunit [Aliidongia sp.]